MIISTQSQNVVTEKRSDGFLTIILFVLFYWPSACH